MNIFVMRSASFHVLRSKRVNNSLLCQQPLALLTTLQVRNKQIH